MAPFFGINPVMKETVLFRFNDHQEVDGIKEFSIEVSMPGQYQRHIIGASQVELATELLDTFEELFALMNIPQNVHRQISEMGEEEFKTEAVFIGSDGNPIPISGFAATAKASFEAEVYRADGSKVEPEEDAERESAEWIADRIENQTS